MEVYIEYVLIDNMVFNSLIVICVQLTVSKAVNKWRVFFSAALGTAVAICLPLLKVGDGFAFLVKTMLAFAMVFVATKRPTIKKYGVSLLFFLVYTFIVGGAIIGLFYLTDVKFDNLATLNYISDVPMGVYLLAVALVVYAIAKLYFYIKNSAQVASFLRKVTCEIDGKSYYLKGYIDSGNSLIDEMTSLPVCFVVDCKLNDELKKIIASQVLTGSGHLVNLHRLNYQTLKGDAKSMCFETVFVINGQRVNIILALTNRHNEEYQILLSRGIQ